jgi:hypothetical protein
LEFLKKYVFEIKHINGKENKVDHAINRRVHEMHASTIRMYILYLKSKILEVVTID